MNDERIACRIAGITALLAGLTTIASAVLDGISRGALESGGADARLALLGQFLLVGENLLLLPVALILWSRLRARSPNLLLLSTVCGVLSPAFWAIGAATRQITPALEASYILLP